MAPNTKPVMKVQRNIKDKPGTPTKVRASQIGVTKKTHVKKTAEKTPLKVNNLSEEVRTTRQRTSTVPKVSTPKPKENRSMPAPETVTQSAKKSVAVWKRRPKPAHSGVPIPAKMRELMEKHKI